MLKVMTSGPKTRRKNGKWKHKDRIINIDNRGAPATGHPCLGLYRTGVIKNVKIGAVADV